MKAPLTLTVDGKAAHALSGGNGADAGATPLVLVHGAGMDARVWAVQAEDLTRRGAHVVAVDLPGHGGSEGPSLATVPDMAAWLIRFLDMAGLARVTLAGHSMGALIALQVAADAPGRVTALGLFGVAARMAVHPALVEAAESDLAKAAEMIAGWGFARDTPVADPAQTIRGLLDNAEPGALARDLRACDGYAEALSAVARVTAPVHLIVGDGDRMTSAQGAEPLRDAGNRVRVTTLPETGHMMMVERPGDVTEALLDLIPTS